MSGVRSAERSGTEMVGSPHQNVACRVTTDSFSRTVQRLLSGQRQESVFGPALARCSEEMHAPQISKICLTGSAAFSTSMAQQGPEASIVDTGGSVRLFSIVS